jgi:signal transduction histidine kinase
MKRLPPISPTIRRSILIIEIFSLVTSIWSNLTSQNLGLSLVKIEFIPLFIIIIFPFIIILPVNRPLWQRRIYIIVAILITLVAEHYEVFTYLLYSTFLLKGCFLLPRRENVAIAISFLIIATLSFTIRAPEIIEHVLQVDRRSYLTLSRIIPNFVIASVGTCLYVLLLGSVWMEEQKSRQRADLLSEQVENLAVDLERNRIARDIHDTLGHSLTSLDVQIELAQRLQATEPERAQKSIDLAKQLSSQALDNVRQALGTMQRSNFDLEQAIVALGEQNLPFQVVIDVQFPKLSLQSSYQLYCIVQESLTNIQKHAQASKVSIEGSIVTGGTILKIGDNGRGFNINRPHPGFGLRNMKERVQCLGGNFDLSSEIDRGTEIKIFIPV